MIVARSVKPAFRWFPRRRISARMIDLDLFLNEISFCIHIAAVLLSCSSMINQWKVFHKDYILGINNNHQFHYQPKSNSIPSGNFGIFFDKFRSISIGKHKKLTGVHRKNPKVSVRNTASMFQYFPVGSHRNVRHGRVSINKWSLQKWSVHFRNVHHTFRTMKNSSMSRCGC